MASGRDDLVRVLDRHGARDDTTPGDRLRYACLLGNRAEAIGLLDRHPALRAGLARTDGSALIIAAESGNTKAVELLLKVGFPASAMGRFNPAGVDGATALHAAAWAGCADVVERLLSAGAQVDALDGHWQSTPLVWALVGSRERRPTHPNPDWVQTVSILLDAGADTRPIDLDPADPHHPSPEVVELLHARGLVHPPGNAIAGTTAKSVDT